MPKIELKTPTEIKIMAEGGSRLGKVLGEVLARIKPGLSTLEIDNWVEEGIAKSGGTPAFKQVLRYHWASCVGLNDEVVHSIPKKDKIIKKGDLLKIDLGMLWEGFNTDMSWTICVEDEDEKCEVRKSFLGAGERALEAAIKVCRQGNRVGHISQTIERVIKGEGFSPVEILTGHGIGRKLHEEPLIPGILKGQIEDSPLLEEGMTLALEVIYGQKSGEVVLEDDGWTISTKDGKISGLFEKTVAITKNGPLVLTPLKRGAILVC